MLNPIVVTGANRRGGLAICQALSAQGFSVLAVHRSAPGVLATLANVHCWQADISDTLARNALIEHIQSHYKALRGIIHNASLWLDDDLENLTQMLSVHVEAPYHLNMALAEQLTSVERSDIIHICDDTAARGTRNHVGYAASKAALLNMTLSFAEKYAPIVRVNAISPGLLALKEDSDEHYRQKTLNKAALPFEPGNGPLVEAVLYLLNASYSTGSNLVINGGRHVRRATSIDKPA